MALWAQQKEAPLRWLITRHVLAAQACLAPCDPRGPQPVGRLCPGDSPGRDNRVGCMPSASGSSQPGDRTWVSGAAGGFRTA